MKPSKYDETHDETRIIKVGLSLSKKIALFASLKVL